ncbi:MAG TPA: hypothetical protein PKC98_20190, partial [Candidatus Melainabacteria bacterium]|nr:hypothetical protein [Candidatus Melainabacteria bacterium]
PTVAMPAMTMTAAVEGAGEEPTDEKVEAPRFQEEERVVRLFNYGDEVAVVLVNEYIPLNAEFLHDDTGFSRFSEASQNGAFEVTVPGGDENEPGETTITYRIKWQLN